MGESYSHRCPSCGGAKIGITDSRPLATGSEPVVRRRRKCHACSHRWSTYEVTADAYDAMQNLMRQVLAWKKMIDLIIETRKLSFPEDAIVELPQRKRNAALLEK